MKLILASIIFLLYSCKVSNTNLTGHYSAKSYHRSSIALDSNNQFKFWNDGYEFMLNNQTFLCTQGSWKRTQPNRLLLNSISDSIAIPHFDIIKRKITNSEKSKFVFINLNKDSVLIMTIYKNGKDIFYRSHGSYLTSFQDSLVKSDTLDFIFTWGFKPVQIIIDSDKPTEYLVTLNREFRPNYFHNTEFIIHRNKLIRVTDKTKFRKTKRNLS